MSKLIDEVRETTANAVAKKQDEAKMNFPKLIERIKQVALTAASSATFPESEMNIYDKKLLEAEGFMVSLIDEPKLDRRYNALTAAAHWIPTTGKILQIKW